MCLGTAILNVHKRSDAIKKLVVLLYIRYSNFFCHFMTWHLGSSWDRIKTTLKNDYYTSEVKPHVTDIVDICKRIESQARLISQSQVQATSDILQTLDDRVKSLYEQTRLHQHILGEHLDQRLQELKELIIGELSHNNVVAMAEHQMYDANVAKATCKSPSDEPVLDSTD